MTISRTPYRISFFGGGTDYPAFYEEHGGSVLSTSINKYCNVNVRDLRPYGFDFEHMIIYRKVEMVSKIGHIEHPAVREAMNHLEVDRGLEISHTGDLPAFSGIGSSAAFMVGILHSLHAHLWKGSPIDKHKLLHDAIYLDREVIGDNCGNQDHAASCYGGFNKFYFTRSGGIRRIKVEVPQDRLDWLNSHLMLVFTKFPRRASDVAAYQIKATPNKIDKLKRMQEMVDEGEDILKNGEIVEFGKLLHESWKLKRSLTKHISTTNINVIYEIARNAGAIGGKLLGAGGGGFMLLFVEPQHQAKVREALNGHVAVEVDFNFETHGTHLAQVERIT